MNKYLKNLNRLEFLITLACTGRCKHCSEGEHTGSGGHIAKDLAESGVNAVLLSLDAFYQETIPLDTVKLFEEAVKAEGVWIRTNPAWLVDVDADNYYNIRTREIPDEFDKMEIERADGNVVFPSGNALKYLSEYFLYNSEYKNPYKENPEDIRAVSVCPNGDVLGGNLYKSHILDIVESYSPLESFKIS